MQISVGSRLLKLKVTYCRHWAHGYVSGCLTGLKEAGADVGHAIEVIIQMVSNEKFMR